MKWRFVFNTCELQHKVKTYGIKTSVRFGLIELIAVFKRAILNRFSMSGEDVVIERLLKHKNQGFYVDVGANDPWRFNNTARFYKMGWSGINIEPNFNKYQALKSHRKRDISLNVGVSLTKRKINFYEFEPDTLCTFSEARATKYLKEGFRLKKQLEVETVPLRDILDQHGKGKVIDFLTVDTEDMDKEVLLSNDWKRFRPLLICVEVVRPNANGDISSFLQEHGYAEIYSNNLNTIYQDRNFVIT